ncbi:MAG: hypothetical protein JNM37_07655 [Rhodocyclaceae bacterium]|nr:hypothetical protein [Rhodocyclaceae bacterium]
MALCEIKWGSVADWVSGLGSFGAVAVALYLAGQDRRLNLKVTAQHSVLVSSVGTPPWPEYLSVRVTNHGRREARITGIGWRIGLFKKRFADQTPSYDDKVSTRMPCKLVDGEEAVFYFPLTEGAGWIKEFSTKVLDRPLWWSLLFAKVRIYTSVGVVFESRLASTLRSTIRARAKTRNAG